MKLEKPYQEIDLSHESFMKTAEDFVRSIDFKLPKKYKPQEESICSKEKLHEVMSSPKRIFQRNFISIKFTKCKELAESLSSYFNRKVSMTGSGYWYPKGGFIGWHTNETNIGWRLYISYCEEPGNSYFRYRHPETHEIITSYDEEWMFRIFKITKSNPLWHCVYSNTNRYSIGFMMQ